MGSRIIMRKDEDWRERIMFFQGTERPVSGILIIYFLRHKLKETYLAEHQLIIIKSRSLELLYLEFQPPSCLALKNGNWQMSL